MMSEEELEAEIDEYVAEHGCERIEAEAAVRFFIKRTEEMAEARRKAFIYQMQELNRCRHSQGEDN